MFSFFRPIKPSIKLPLNVNGKYNCVLFDLGGVVFESPIDAVKRYQEKLIKSGKMSSEVNLNEAFVRSQAFHDLETGRYESVEVSLYVCNNIRENNYRDFFIFAAHPSQIFDIGVEDPLPISVVVTFCE